MELLQRLRDFVNRLQFAVTDAGRQVRKESAHAFLSALGELKGDAESFATGLKAYSSRPPAVASLRRWARPLRGWKS